LATTNPFTDIYHLRITDINVIQLYLEYFFIAQCTFINIKSKLCFTIRNESI